MPSLASSGTDQFEADTPLEAVVESDRSVDYDLSEEEISIRAYECWLERGSPLGSPEIDWAKAEEDLRSQRSKKPAAAAASA
jgi:Protein of unknown function (DUF2934)